MAFSMRRMAFAFGNQVSVTRLRWRRAVFPRPGREFAVVARARNIMSDKIEDILLQIRRRCR